jgi:hypothetical protein
VTVARRRTRPAFETLWDAIRDGTAADVRAVIAAAGGIPEEREEYGDPTPLMYAAALGHLDDVQALVEAGADVNELAEHGIGDLPDLPFVDELKETDELLASISALGYAVGYGRDEVAAFLGPLTAANRRRGAEAIAAARRDYLARLSDKARDAFLQKCERKVTGVEAERQALLRDHPKLARWIVPCVGCQRLGYLAKLPVEIDKRGTAAAARRLFRPLSADNFACERCQPKFERARRDGEALMQKRLAELPPHVRVEVVQPKPRKKKPPADT